MTGQTPAHDGFDRSPAEWPPITVEEFDKFWTDALESLKRAAEEETDKDRT